MTYSFHEEAESEFNDAIDHYEGCRKGLGFEFASEVYETIQRIVKQNRVGTQFLTIFEQSQPQRPYLIHLMKMKCFKCTRMGFEQIELFIPYRAYSILCLIVDE